MVGNYHNPAMTSPIETIQVICPKCQTRFKSYYRASFSMGDIDIKKMTIAHCPMCKHKIDLAGIDMDDDGCVANQ